MESVAGGGEGPRVVFHQPRRKWSYKGAIWMMGYYLHVFMIYIFQIGGRREGGVGGRGRIW